MPNVGGTLSRSIFWSGFSRSCCAPYSTWSSAPRTTRKKSAPLRVSSIPRAWREKRRTCSQSSSAATCRLIAPWVMCSSCAACVKLACLDAASNARSAFSGGSRRAIGYYFFSWLVCTNCCAPSTARRYDRTMREWSTLFDTIWQAHVITHVDDSVDLLGIDRHLVHEVSSAEAFRQLAATRRRVAEPRHTFACMTTSYPR